MSCFVGAYGINSIDGFIGVNSSRSGPDIVKADKKGRRYYGKNNDPVQPVFGVVIMKMMRLAGANYFIFIFHIGF
jgi:hypothetical protein